MRFDKLRSCHTHHPLFALPIKFLHLCKMQHKIISAEYSFLLTYFPQKRIIISEMGNHHQESSCQIVENFINQEIPCQTVGNFKIEG